jgi:hypothetical protein
MSVISLPPPELAALLRNASDLRTKVFVPLRWIVPKYLPEGITLLVGRPKIGKSWLALEAGIAVATGGICLDEACEQGDVLALFLEDTDRRIQRRMTAMLGINKQSWPSRLQYATSWPLLDSGGIDLIREWIVGVPKPRLVILDVLQRLRTPPKRQDTQYSADYEALTGLQGLAGEAQISIITLHHQRKAAADDLHDTVSGTHGLTGSADATLVLGKGEHGKFLYGRGRDLEEFNVAIEQDASFRWRVGGPAAAVLVSGERAAIIAALKKAAAPMRLKEIAETVGSKYDNVKALLSKLHENGVVEKAGRGLYRLAPAEGV